MRKVQKYKVEIVGIRPLLQNDSFGTETNAKKGQVYDPQEEAEKRLILDKDDNICQKASHIEGAMTKSATDFKVSGRKTYKDLFKSAVTVEPVMILHLIPDWVIDSQSVKVQQARIMRCRPRFDEWRLRFQIVVSDERIQPLILKQILENAGLYIGIGDYRPKYGLFEIEEFKTLTTKVNGKTKTKKKKISK